MTTYETRQIRKEIERIRYAKLRLSKRNPGKTLRIKVTPEFLMILRRLQDDDGNCFITFENNGKYLVQRLLGMKVVVDMESWKLF